MYGKVDWISTASGSERASVWAALATARGTDPYCHLSMPYIVCKRMRVLWKFIWHKSLIAARRLHLCLTFV